jgi:hypothetical protein
MLDSYFEVEHCFGDTCYRDEDVLPIPLRLKVGNQLFIVEQPFVRINTRQVFQVLREKISPHIETVVLQNIVLDYMTPKSVFIDANPNRALHDTHRSWFVGPSRSSVNKGRVFRVIAPHIVEFLGLYALCIRDDLAKDQNVASVKFCLVFKDVVASRLNVFVAGYQNKVLYAWAILARDNPNPIANWCQEHASEWLHAHDDKWSLLDSK